MSIMDRIKRLTQANVNAVLDRAENPEKMLKQRVRELEEAVNAAKQAVADFAVTFKKTEKEEEQLKRLRAEWQAKAESALKAGEEDMARRAMGEKLKADERIAALQPSLTQSRETYTKLKDNLTLVSDQLREARLKYAELQSRGQAAAAQKTFTAAMDRAGGTAGSGDGEFAKFEEKVLQEESAVEIEREVRGDMAAEQIDRLSRDLKVDAELDALKKKLKK